MLTYCLLFTIPWLATARSQHVSTVDPISDIDQDIPDAALKYPLPYVQYFNVDTTNDETHIEILPEQFYPMDNTVTDTPRNKRHSESEEELTAPMNFADTDKTVYLVSGENGSPFVLDVNEASGEENTTDFLEAMEKRDFSPWGGKRGSNSDPWIWKRHPSRRDPNMPKRVRFSPWGGKRSGHLIMKNGEPKGAKLIFSSTIPELTKFISSVSKSPINFDGYQEIHTLDKRRPIKYITLDERTLKEALPFKTFLGYLPSLFKSGHTYTDVNFKKDGKRKVKFSAWGGKRSPPIIGPVWKPLKDSALTTIYLLRNMKDSKM